jgi:hypothetical protein
LTWILLEVQRLAGFQEQQIPQPAQTDLPTTNYFVRGWPAGNIRAWVGIFSAIE